MLASTSFIKHVSVTLSVFLAGEAAIELKSDISSMKLALSNIPAPAGALSVLAEGPNQIDLSLTTLKKTNPNQWLPDITSPNELNYPQTNDLLPCDSMPKKGKVCYSNSPLISVATTTPWCNMQIV